MRRDTRDLLAILAAVVFAVVVLGYGGVMLWCAAPDERMGVFKEIGAMGLPIIAVVFGYYFGKEASTSSKSDKGDRPDKAK
jgi:hypothetical protein